MTSHTRQEIARRLGLLAELAPEVRMGQLMAHLGFLSEDEERGGLWDVEDHDLIKVIDRHEAELSRRRSNVA
jgi:hypothetical protein